MWVFTGYVSNFPVGIFFSHSTFTWSPHRGHTVSKKRWRLITLDERCEVSSSPKPRKSFAAPVSVLCSYVQENQCRRFECQWLSLKSKKKLIGSIPKWNYISALLRLAHDLAFAWETQFVAPTGSPLFMGNMDTPGSFAPLTTGCSCYLVQPDNIQGKLSSSLTYNFWLYLLWTYSFVDRY